MEQGLSNPTLITRGWAVQYENGGDSWLPMCGFRPLTDGNGGGRCSTPDRRVIRAKHNRCENVRLSEQTLIAPVGTVQYEKRGNP